MTNAFSWIFEIKESKFTHFKEANSICRTKTILHSTKNSVALVLVSFEKEYRVHKVFKCFWTRQVTIFCHMTNENNSGVGIFRKVHKCLGDRPNLSHSPTRTALRFRIENTDRVYDNYRMGG